MDMRYIHLLAFGAAMLASPAAAQQGSAPRITYPSQSHLFSWERGSSLGNGMLPACRHGCFHRGVGSVFIVEREVPVIVERVVVKEAPPPPAANLGTPNRDVPTRKPYAIGASYSSLPDSCMKLIEDGAFFFYCSGEWYRQEGAANYRAIKRKL